MLKDLLEKFDGEFDERFRPQIMNSDECSECRVNFKNLKSLAHSHIEAAYQSNLEMLIEKCGDRFESLRYGEGLIAGTSVWTASSKSADKEVFHCEGSTPTEAVENLIKSLNL